jgi:predicted amidohydrolase
MRFHAVQTAPLWLDAAENRRNIETMLTTLAPERGDFVVLPEMCETGWTSNADALRAVHGSTEWIASLARTHQVWLQAGFGEHAGAGRIANSVAVSDPSGVIRAVYRKNFLFPSERDAFAAGDELIVIDTGAAKVCPLICYDLRFPELWRLASRAGAEVFTVSSSWPSVRHEHWRALLVARAIENQAFVFASNRTGSDPSLMYDGGSVAIDPLGVRLGEARDHACTVSAAFDRAQLDEWRAKFGALRDARDTLLGSITLRAV